MAAEEIDLPTSKEPTSEKARGRKRLPEAVSKKEKKILQSPTKTVCTYK
jgi:hypothetical protein